MAPDLVRTIAYLIGYSSAILMSRRRLNGETPEGIDDGLSHSRMIRAGQIMLPSRPRSYADPSRLDHVHLKSGYPGEVLNGNGAVSGGSAIGSKL